MNSLEVIGCRNAIDVSKVQSESLVGMLLEFVANELIITIVKSSVGELDCLLSEEWRIVGSYL